MTKRVVAMTVLLVLVALVAETQAGALLVAGSPEYDSTTSTGLKDGEIFGLTSPSCVNSSGMAVGTADKYVSASSKGPRGVRWDASGTAGTELGGLGTGSGGSIDGGAYAINNAGTAVGYAEKYVIGRDFDYRAVRWDASSASAVEMGNLGVDSMGCTIACAYAINDVGTAAGHAFKYVDGVCKGYRAVRWDASGTAVELGDIGTNSSGFSHAYAYAINDVGTVAGFASKGDGNGNRGHRAVRWDASGTAAVELDHLGTDGSGCTEVFAYAINDAGTIVGNAFKYVDATYKGRRAVRWDASGTVAVELGNLGTDSTGETVAFANAVNNAGIAVGGAYKYVDGEWKDRRAVRWDASGAATELGNLGTDHLGRTNASAFDINDAGTAVGYAKKLVSIYSDGDLHAVIWLPDGIAIDLNDLGIAPVSSTGTWTLTSAKAISADGWVAGEGTFHPDAGASYTRLWVTQVGLGGRWTNGAGGTWGRGPNWSTGTPAMQAGDATFNLAESYTVSLDRDGLTKTIAIDAGTVTLDLAGHTLATESGLTIAQSATLQVAGMLTSDVVNAGTLAPGMSPGSLTIDGNLTNTGTLEFEIAGATTYDAIDLTGDFTAGGTIAVRLLDGYTPVGGQQFDLMDFSSLIDNGYQFDFTAAELPLGMEWDTCAFAATGRLGVTGIPEPATWALLTTAALALLCHRRRCVSSQTAARQ